jgi:hypothetical protein
MSCFKHWSSECIAAQWCRGVEGRTAACKCCATAGLQHFKVHGTRCSYNNKCSYNDNHSMHGLSALQEMCSAESAAAASTGSQGDVTQYLNSKGCWCCQSCSCFNDLLQQLILLACATLSYIMS